MGFENHPRLQGKVLAGWVVDTSPDNGQGSTNMYELKICAANGSNFH
jgi:hypothetical protein